MALLPGGLAQDLRRDDLCVIVGLVVGDPGRSVADPSVEGKLHIFTYLTLSKVTIEKFDQWLRSQSIKTGRMMAEGRSASW